jgi:hypothetical protein
MWLFTQTRGSKTVGRVPRGVPFVLWGGGELIVWGTYLFWMKYGFKVKRPFAWLKYFTNHLVPVVAPNYKQHILWKCYPLAGLYVKCVYFNLFGWRGGGRRSWNFLKAGANCKKLGTSAIDYFTSDVRKAKNINVKRTKSFKKLCSFETVHLWLTGTFENCVFMFNDIF